jgi:hypothetical protein
MAKAAEEAAAGAEAMTAAAAGAKVGSQIDIMSFLSLVCLRLIPFEHVIWVST